VLIICFGFSVRVIIWFRGSRVQELFGNRQLAKEKEKSFSLSLFTLAKKTLSTTKFFE
jgi:hypothetical protein